MHRKRESSISDRRQKIYPYLFVIHADKLLSADITNIRMERGWLYLVAIMDWFSRYVLSWELSTTLEWEFCVTAWKQALSFGRPEIFNTDRGSQFTSGDFA